MMKSGPTLEHLRLARAFVERALRTANDPSANSEALVLALSEILYDREAVAVARELAVEHPTAASKNDTERAFDDARSELFGAINALQCGYKEIGLHRAEDAYQKLSKIRPPEAPTSALAFRRLDELGKEVVEIGRQLRASHMTTKEASTPLNPQSDLALAREFCINHFLRPEIEDSVLEFIEKIRARFRNSATEEERELVRQRETALPASEK